MRTARAESENYGVYAALGSYVLARVFDDFNRPGGGVMLVMLFNIL